MRRTNRQLRVIINSPTPNVNLTDTSGSPSESYNWDHLANLRREWLHEFWTPPGADNLELTFAEITSIETLVRGELYP
jgi:hypothetical protein